MHSHTEQPRLIKMRDFLSSKRDEYTKYPPRKREIQRREGN